MKSIASNRYLIATKGAVRGLVPLEVLAVPFHVPTRKIDALRFFPLPNIQVLINTTMLLLLKRLIRATSYDVVATTSARPPSDQLRGMTFDHLGEGTIGHYRDCEGH
jgi:hypothetical protein